MHVNENFFPGIRPCFGFSRSCAYEFVYQLLPSKGQLKAALLRRQRRFGDVYDGSFSRCFGERRSEYLTIHRSNGQVG